MKKVVFVLISMLVLILHLPFKEESSLAATEKIIINTSYAYLYEDENFETHYEFKIKANEILVCQSSTDKYYEVLYNYNENDYHGYIRSEFASIYLPPQEVNLVYNGKITNKTNVLELNTDQFLNDIILEPGHEIYIYEGFDSKNEYTNIKFSFNGQIYTGKVITKDLSPYGINKAVIISLSIISALVGAILILLGINKKKWHILLKNKKK